MQASFLSAVLLPLALAVVLMGLGISLVAADFYNSKHHSGVSFMIAPPIVGQVSSNTAA